LRCPRSAWATAVRARSRASISWVLPRRVMGLPIVSRDSQLLKILTTHADDLLAERHSVTELQSMVANQLASLLPSGESRAAAVARQLGMSQRSLTRRLAEEGTTFAASLSSYGAALPLVTWRMTACQSSRPPGCSVIRKSGRSITPTRGGPEPHPGGRESLARHRNKRCFPSPGVAISTFWPELSSEGARQRPTSPTCDGNLPAPRRREDDGKLGRWHR
jgi:hypothetical protein